MAAFPNSIERKNAIVLYLNFEGKSTIKGELFYVRVAWVERGFSEKNSWRNNSF
jgi:hypothetical protein